MKLRFALLVGLVTASAPASAVICKTVDADGVVSYSDVPAAECPEKIKLPDYSRYSPRPVAPAAVSGSEVQDQTAFTGYREIAIVTPEANGTVRNNEGRVPVAVSLEPALRPDHRVALFLDARQVEGSFSGTSIELSGVERGTHTLRAEVRDQDGSVLINSASILFTMRQRGLFDGAKDIENPIEPVVPPLEPPRPGYGAPDSNPDYSPRAPNYSPPSGGIPSTPGRTNPAFAPNFSR